MQREMRRSEDRTRCPHSRTKTRPHKETRTNELTRLQLHVYVIHCHTHTGCVSVSVLQIASAGEDAGFPWEPETVADAVSESWL